MTQRRSRAEAESLVQFVVDDTLNGRPVASDQHAVIRECGPFKYASVIAICRCKGDKRIGVAVHSHTDTLVTADEAVELATDYLTEIQETVQSVEISMTGC